MSSAQCRGVQGSAGRCRAGRAHAKTCIMQTSQVLKFSAIDVEHIATYTPGTVVNLKCSGSTVVLAKILGPSERGAEYRSITYEWSGCVVTHDCAPIARMSLPSTPTTCHTSLKCQAVREKDVLPATPPLFTATFVLQIYCTGAKNKQSK